MSFVNTTGKFEKQEKNFSKQEEKLTTYSIKPDLFQINTYTSQDNKNSGHSDQVIQFDLKGLSDFFSIIKKEYPNLFSDNGKFNISKVKVDLLDKNGNPQYGLNWGQRTGREPNQAYIQLPIEVYRSDFFPKKPEHFFIHTDDGLDIKFTRAQKTDEGTALQTPDDNSYFGKYIRDRLGISHGQEITAKDILDYGCKEITFFKINDKYYMDFSRGVPLQEKSASFVVSSSVLPLKLSKFSNSKIDSRYILSLLAKPFVILSGNSGTGKTRIALRFAKYLEKQTDTEITNTLLIPVGADWTDNTKILGYFNPLANDGKGEYVKSEILSFLELTKENPSIPFFLILDEMNLSHVERYFSDFLSAMESGEPILLYKKPEDCECVVPEKITLPENLFVTGTVNIDETTYMFSPKVLDRANVIEFKPEMKDVLDNLISGASSDEQKTAESGVAEGFMELANKIRNGDVSDELKNELEKIKPVLESIYKILEKSGFEFAYRTAKEIRLYAIASYETCEDKSQFNINSVIDQQIVQKILPKIHGNKKQIGSMLVELKTELENNEDFELSQAKVSSMIDKLEKYQYASFI